MKIAVVGSGISGMTAALFLSAKHEVTLYERENYFGGHSRTIEVPCKDSLVPVDTGFIVYNQRNYPLLTKMFAYLGVKTAPSSMTFGASIDSGWLEYGTSSLQSIFAQPRNLLRPDFYRMINDVRRFFAASSGYLNCSPDLTLGKLVDDLKVGDWFKKYFLMPMGGAIWSCPFSVMKDFPARTFLQFFHNHGLLSFHGQPQWRTVAGGSREYVKLLLNAFPGIKLNQAVNRVSRANDKVEIYTDDSSPQSFDSVVFACHADEALALLEQPTPEEISVLKCFRYQDNQAILHNDTSLMPVQRRAWSSWVYLLDGHDDQKARVSLTYWMNNLQPLKTANTLLVTLNPSRTKSSATIFDSHLFTHPILDASAISAQDRIAEIQGKHKAWFVGAYQRYGFHEDGIWSAVRVAQAMGVKPPWE